MDDRECNNIMNHPHYKAMLNEHVKPNSVSSSSTETSSVLSEPCSARTVQLLVEHIDKLRLLYKSECTANSCFRAHVEHTYQKALEEEQLQSSLLASAVSLLHGGCDENQGKLDFQQIFLITRALLCKYTYVSNAKLFILPEFSPTILTLNNSEVANCTDASIKSIPLNRDSLLHCCIVSNSTLMVDSVSSDHRYNRNIDIVSGVSNQFLHEEGLTFLAIPIYSKKGDRFGSSKVLAVIELLVNLSDERVSVSRIQNFFELFTILISSAVERYLAEFMLKDSLKLKLKKKDNYLCQFLNLKELINSKQSISSLREAERMICQILSSPFSNICFQSHIYIADARNKQLWKYSCSEMSFNSFDDQMLCLKFGEGFLGCAAVKNQKSFSSNVSKDLCLFEAAIPIQGKERLLGLIHVSASAKEFESLPFEEFEEVLSSNAELNFFVDQLPILVSHFVDDLEGSLANRNVIAIIEKIEHSLYGSVSANNLSSKDILRNALQSIKNSCRALIIGKNIQTYLFLADDYQNEIVFIDHEGTSYEESRFNSSAGLVGHVMCTSKCVFEKIASISENPAYCQEIDGIYLSNSISNEAQLVLSPLPVSSTSTGMSIYNYFVNTMHLTHQNQSTLSDGVLCFVCNDSISSAEAHNLINFSYILPLVLRSWIKWLRLYRDQEIVSKKLEMNRNSLNEKAVFLNRAMEFEKFTKNLESQGSLESTICAAIKDLQNAFKVDRVNIFLSDNARVKKKSDTINDFEKSQADRLLWTVCEVHDKFHIIYLVNDLRGIPGTAFDKQINISISEKANLHPSFNGLIDRELNFQTSSSSCIVLKNYLGCIEFANSQSLSELPVTGCKFVQGFISAFAIQIEKILAISQSEELSRASKIEIKELKTLHDNASENLLTGIQSIHRLCAETIVHCNNECSLIEVCCEGFKKLNKGCNMNVFLVEDQDKVEASEDILLKTYIKSTKVPERYEAYRIPLDEEQYVSQCIRKMEFVSQVNENFSPLFAKGLTVITGTVINCFNIYPLIDIDKNITLGAILLSTDTPHSSSLNKNCIALSTIISSALILKLKNIRQLSKLEAKVNGLCDSALRQHAEMEDFSTRETKNSKYLAQNVMLKRLVLEIIEDSNEACLISSTCSIFEEECTRNQIKNVKISVFLLKENLCESYFWTISSKGLCNGDSKVDDIIKLPVSSGILGRVFRTGNISHTWGGEDLALEFDQTMNIFSLADQASTCQNNHFIAIPGMDLKGRLRGIVLLQIETQQVHETIDFLEMDFLASLGTTFGRKVSTCEYNRQLANTILASNKTIEIQTHDLNKLRNELKLSEYRQSINEQLSKIIEGVLRCETFVLGLELTVNGIQQIFNNPDSMLYITNNGFFKQHPFIDAIKKYTLSHYMEYADHLSLKINKSTLGFVNRCSSMGCLLRENNDIFCPIYFRINRIINSDDAVDENEENDIIVGALHIAFGSQLDLFNSSSSVEDIDNFYLKLTKRVSIALDICRNRELQSFKKLNSSHENLSLLNKLKENELKISLNRQRCAFFRRVVDLCFELFGKSQVSYSSLFSTVEQKLSAILNNVFVHVALFSSEKSHLLHMLPSIPVNSKTNEDDLKAVLDVSDNKMLKKYVNSNEIMEVFDFDSDILFQSLNLLKSNCSELKLIYIPLYVFVSMRSEVTFIENASEKNNDHKVVVGVIQLHIPKRESSDFYSLKLIQRLLSLSLYFSNNQIEQKNRISNFEEANDKRAVEFSHLLKEKEDIENIHQSLTTQIFGAKSISQSILDEVIRNLDCKSISKLLSHVLKLTEESVVSKLEDINNASIYVKQSSHNMCTSQPQSKTIPERYLFYKHESSHEGLQEVIKGSAEFSVLEFVQQEATLQQMRQHPVNSKELEVSSFNSFFISAKEYSINDKFHTFFQQLHSTPSNYDWYFLVTWTLPPEYDVVIMMLQTHSKKTIPTDHNIASFSINYIMDMLSRDVMWCLQYCKQAQIILQDKQALLSYTSTNEEELHRLSKVSQNKDRLVNLTNLLLKTDFLSIYQAALIEAKEIFEVETALFFQFNETDNALLAISLDSSQNNSLFPLNSGTVGRVFADGGILCINNSSIVNELSGKITSSGIYGLILGLRNNKLGVLALYGKKNGFHENDQSTFMKFITLAGTAISVKHDIFSEREIAKKFQVDSGKKDMYIADIEAQISELSQAQAMLEDQLQVEVKKDTRLQNLLKIVIEFENTNNVEELLHTFGDRIQLLHSEVLSVRVFKVISHPKKLRLVFNGRNAIDLESEYELNTSLSGLTVLSNSEEFIMLNGDQNQLNQKKYNENIDGSFCDDSIVKNDLSYNYICYSRPLKNIFLEPIAVVTYMIKTHGDSESAIKSTGYSIVLNPHFELYHCLYEMKLNSLHLGEQMQDQLDSNRVNKEKLELCIAKCSAIENNATEQRKFYHLLLQCLGEVNVACDERGVSHALASNKCVFNSLSVTLLLANVETAEFQFLAGNLEAKNLILDSCSYEFIKFCDCFNSEIWVAYSTKTVVQVYNSQIQKTITAVPLSLYRDSEIVLAVLKIERDQNHKFSEFEVSVLSTFCVLVAQKLESLRVENERYVRELGTKSSVRKRKIKKDLPQALNDEIRLPHQSLNESKYPSSSSKKLVRVLRACDFQQQLLGFHKQLHKVSTFHDLFQIVEKVMTQLLHVNKSKSTEFWESEVIQDNAASLMKPLEFLKLYLKLDNECDEYYSFNDDGHKYVVKFEELAKNSSKSTYVAKESDESAVCSNFYFISKNTLSFEESCSDRKCSLGVLVIQLRSAEGFNKHQKVVLGEIESSLVCAIEKLNNQDAQKQKLDESQHLNEEYKLKITNASCYDKYKIYSLEVQCVQNIEEMQEVVSDHLNLLLDVDSVSLKLFQGNSESSEFKIESSDSINTPMTKSVLKILLTSRTGKVLGFLEASTVLNRSFTKIEQELFSDYSCCVSHALDYILLKSSLQDLKQKSEDALDKQDEIRIENEQLKQTIEKLVEEKTSAVTTAELLKNDKKRYIDQMQGLKERILTLENEVLFGKEKLEQESIDSHRKYRELEQGIDLKNLEIANLTEKFLAIEKEQQRYICQIRHLDQSLKSLESSKLDILDENEVLKQRLNTSAKRSKQYRSEREAWKNDAADIVKRYEMRSLEFERTQDEQDKIILNQKQEIKRLQDKMASYNLLLESEQKEKEEQMKKLQLHQLREVNPINSHVHALNTNKQVGLRRPAGG